MSTTELQHLLYQLVTVWPSDEENSAVRQAREYLENQQMSFGEQYPYQVERGEHDDFWYSL
jgi:hypothetical protein